MASQTSSVASVTMHNNDTAAAIEAPAPNAHKSVRLTAGRVEKLVTSLERIAGIFASLGAETREINKALRILLKPSAATNKRTTPSAYNIFIKDNMPKVRSQHPEATAKERMQLCAELWRQSKADTNGEENDAEEHDDDEDQEEDQAE